MCDKKPQLDLLTPYPPVLLFINIGWEGKPIPRGAVVPLRVPRSLRGSLWQVGDHMGERQSDTSCKESLSIEFI